MTDLKDLVNAAAEHRQEDTPVAMLADHLIEQGDGRGELLRRWLESDRPPLSYDDVVCGPSHADRITGRHWLSTDLNNVKGVPVFRIRINSFVGDRSFEIPVDHAEARRIASTPPFTTTGPFSKRMHKFLDTEFGPDPRYNDSLNKALKPEQE